MEAKDTLPDQRKFVVIPIRAGTDKRLTLGMLRSLILICSFQNRSGITWVSQARLAADTGVTQQAISRHLVKLTKAGYLEVLKRPVPGEKHTTWRIIFDPSIKAEDAISLISSIEDTRPPYMKQEQQAEETSDPAGQARIASLIAKAFKSPTTTQERTMPKTGETVTTKRMKEEIAQAKAKRSKGTHTQPPEVVPHAQPQAVDNSVHAQPFGVSGTTYRGCTEHKEHSIREDVYKDSLLRIVMHNSDIDLLIEGGLTIEQVAENLDILLPLYRAEGIEPSSSVLAIGIRQLQVDVR